MNTPHVTHPTQDTITAHIHGQLPPDVALSLQKHLDSCPECQRVVTVTIGKELKTRSYHGPATDESALSAARYPLAREAELPPELRSCTQYTEIRQLGQGGMGIVYLARNILLDRLEVLKVLNHIRLGAQSHEELFLREIKSLARLQHPNIVTAYSALSLGKLVVFCMEYVPGTDLAKIVQERGSLPVANSCYYTYQAASGLQHAHEMGLIHRDIKPSNLIVHVNRTTKRHVLKILDFGLAKLSAAVGTGLGLTGSGVMIGTPDFVSPEQIQDARSVDIRADIYSLGCSLFYMLTGRSPFSGTSIYSIFEQHCHHEPPLERLSAIGIAPELISVIGTMMAKNPRDRYQTPAEVMSAMAPFLKRSTSAQNTPIATPHTPATETRSTNKWGSTVREQPQPLLAHTVIEEEGVVDLTPRSPSPTRPNTNNPGKRPSVNDAARKRPTPPTNKRSNFKWIAIVLAALLFCSGVIGIAMVVIPNIGKDDPKKTDSANDESGIPFTPLFNGKTIDGWIPVPLSDASNKPTSTWQVVNSRLRGSPQWPKGPFGGLEYQGPWYLFSERDNYKDFHLRAKVRINDGGSAGLYLRASTLDSARKTKSVRGYKAVINTNGTDRYYTGSIYGIGTPGKLSAAKADVWFNLEVILRGNDITVKIDGTETLSYKDPQQQFQEGHIVIQADNFKSSVEIESIEIKELNKPSY